MAGKGSAPGERRGGRQKGTPNTLPDLRAITLRALMKAGGVDYLTRQAHENPGPFLGLLGKVMPREVHTELSGELKVRAEVRRDLVEKLVVLMASPASPASQAIEHETPPPPLPAITHTPDTMLKAQALKGAGEAMSNRRELARKEGAQSIAGAVERAESMHRERIAAREAAIRETQSMQGGSREGSRGGLLERAQGVQGVRPGAPAYAGTREGV